MEWYRIIDTELMIFFRVRELCACYKLQFTENESCAYMVPTYPLHIYVFSLLPKRESGRVCIEVLTSHEHELMKKNAYTLGLFPHYISHAGVCMRMCTNRK